MGHKAHTASGLTTTQGEHLWSVSFKTELSVSLLVQLQMLILIFVGQIYQKQFVVPISSNMTIFIPTASSWGGDVGLK